MSKTTKQVEPGAAYALPDELKAAIGAAHDALARRKKLDDAISNAPAQVAEKEREIASLRAELATAEADILFVDEGKLSALQKQIDKMVATIDARDLEVRRIKARIDALERRAPEIDGEIDVAGNALNIEASMFAAALKVRIGAELRDVMPAVRAVLNKARALDGIGHCRDFFAAAFVPDMEFFVPHTLANGATYGHTNLLDNDTPREPNAIDELLAPVRAAMAAVRKHAPYVPLSRRQQPYVIKGAEGPGGRPVAPTPRPEVAPHNPTARNAPYEMKGSTQARGGVPQEMDIGRALMAAADSADHH